VNERSSGLASLANDIGDVRGFSEQRQIRRDELDPDGMAGKALQLSRNSPALSRIAAYDEQGIDSPTPEQTPCHRLANVLGSSRDQRGNRHVLRPQCESASYRGSGHIVQEISLMAGEVGKGVAKDNTSKRR
jgi:hypothetical protein